MFLEATTGNSAGGGALFWIIYFAIIIGVMYLVIIRPQKKQQKAREELQSGMEPGDSIMTTGGFYGTILDIDGDTVIVEFGNNKNCRIPMHKNAIAEVEKAGSAVVKEDSEEK